jgi:hypothetical protein
MFIISSYRHTGSESRDDSHTHKRAARICFANSAAGKRRVFALQIAPQGLAPPQKKISRFGKVL